VLLSPTLCASFAACVTDLDAHVLFVFPVLFLPTAPEDVWLHPRLRHLDLAAQPVQAHTLMSLLSDLLSSCSPQKSCGSIPDSDIRTSLPSPFKLTHLCPCCLICCFPAAPRRCVAPSPTQTSGPRCPACSSCGMACNLCGQTTVGTWALFIRRRPRSPSCCKGEKQHIKTKCRTVSALAAAAKVRSNTSKQSVEQCQPLQLLQR